jgi:hypothetical protein
MSSDTGMSSDTSGRAIQLAMDHEEHDRDGHLDPRRWGSGNGFLGRSAGLSD